MKTVLVYTRPGLVEQFRKLAELVFPDCRVELISEHRDVDESGLIDLYYRNLDNAKKGSEFLAEDVTHDTILRCRWLRNLSIEEAHRHLDAMARAISRVLGERDMAAILSLTVDSYVIDLLNILGERQGVPFLGLVQSFMNNYFRITTRGEFRPLHEPGADEVDTCLNQLLQPHYTPDFMRNALSFPKKKVWERWIKNWGRPPYFSLKARLKQDPFNYHYQAQSLISRENRTWFPVSDPASEDWQGAIAGHNGLILYCPLQLFPEATIDYWCKNVAVIEYHRNLISTLQRLSESFLILIKEHPGAIGHRQSSFFQQLRSVPGVVIAPTFYSSNALLLQCDAVLVWTGSVGFEATLRGIPVLTKCAPYYASGSRYIDISGEFEPQELVRRVGDIKSCPVSREEQLDQVRFLLSGLLSGRFSLDKSWRPDVKQDYADLEQTAKSISEYLLRPS